jgi:hypothetical protein
MLAHAVFFTLHESTPETRAAAVASCRRLLSGHEGMIHFSAGERGPEFARPVNDLAFDVALFTIFADKAAHDRYQSDPRHLEFIESNRPLWREVRVFDAWV